MRIENVAEKTVLGHLVACVKAGAAVWGATVLPLPWPLLLGGYCRSFVMVDFNSPKSCLSCIQFLLGI